MLATRPARSERLYAVISRMPYQSPRAWDATSSVSDPGNSVNVTQYVSTMAAL